MSRKFDRKARVISLATKVLNAEVSNPRFINNIVLKQIKGKPVWIPKFIWAKLVDLVINPAQ